MASSKDKKTAPKRQRSVVDDVDDDDVDDDSPEAKKRKHRNSLDRARYSSRRDNDPNFLPNLAAGKRRQRAKKRDQQAVQRQEEDEEEVEEGEIVDRMAMSNPAHNHRQEGDRDVVQGIVQGNQPTEAATATGVQQVPRKHHRPFSRTCIHRLSVPYHAAMHSTSREGTAINAQSIGRTAFDSHARGYPTTGHCPRESPSRNQAASSVAMDTQSIGRTAVDSRARGHPTIRGRTHESPSRSQAASYAALDTQPRVTQVPGTGGKHEKTAVREYSSAFEPPASSKNAEASGNPYVDSHSLAVEGTASFTNRSEPEQDDEQPSPDDASLDTPRAERAQQSPIEIRFDELLANLGLNCSQKNALSHFFVETSISSRDISDIIPAGHDVRELGELSCGIKRVEEKLDYLGAPLGATFGRKICHVQYLLGQGLQGDLHRLVRIRNAMIHNPAIGSFEAASTTRMDFCSLVRHVLHGLDSVIIQQDERHEQDERNPDRERSPAFNSPESDRPGGRSNQRLHHAHQTPRPDSYYVHSPSNFVQGRRARPSSEYSYHQCPPDSTSRGRQSSHQLRPDSRDSTSRGRQSNDHFHQSHRRDSQDSAASYSNNVYNRRDRSRRSAGSYSNNVRNRRDHNSRSSY